MYKRQGNKYPQDTEVLKHKLDVRGLRICNAWFSTLFTSQPYEVTEEAFLKHRDRLYALGARVIGASEQGDSIQGKPLNIFGDQKPVYTEEEWKKVTEGFNRLGKLAAEKGMKLTCHHHMGTGVQTEAEICLLYTSQRLCRHAGGEPCLLQGYAQPGCAGGVHPGGEGAIRYHGQPHLKKRSALKYI